MKALHSGLLILAGAVVLAGCTHTSEPGEDLIPIEEFDASRVEGEPVSDIARAEFDYELKMEDFSYSPNTIAGAPGMPLRIKLTNTQGMHDFVIPELGVASGVIQQGEDTIFEFTIPESAANKTYEFYCSIGNHREMGMVGTLLVAGPVPEIDN